MDVQELMRKKKTWKDESTNNHWKEENLKTIKKRMKGWQLTTFNESYKNKIMTGVSIYKKKILLKNN